MSKLPILLVAKDKALYFLPSIDSLDVISGKDLLDPVYFNFFHPKLKEYELIVFFRLWIRNGNSCEDPPLYNS